jgi:hypothetical protein
MKKLKLKSPFKNIAWWVIKKYARNKLWRRRVVDYEVELINEKWLIKRIGDGQTPRRPELAECQGRIKEISAFIKWLEKTK